MLRMSARLCATLVIGLLASDPAQAQTSRFDVTGVIVDSSGIGLPHATIVALTRADSVLTKFATAGNNGAFTLRRMTVGDYILQVTFVGFQSLRKDFSILDADVDVGVVRLALATGEMGELVVSADHIPFVVKRDTLEYNAGAFITRPSDMVEDLLRRLPGIEVEDDGTITAQGETVDNVLVEGKEFFGSDPTIATRNLPAEAVERVQVYDKQSDKAEFTGVPDGEEEKTINLELNDDAKRGFFGQVTGAFGGERIDQNRYDGHLNINRFSPTTQLAVIASGNDVNRQAFGWGEGRKFGGGGIATIRGGNDVQIGGDLSDGFSETLAMGLNASRDFGADSWIRSSYFLSDLNNRQERVVLQQQLLGSELAAFTDLSSNQRSDNLSHALNLNAQATFSEGHDARLRVNLSKGAASLTSSGLQNTMDSEHAPQNTASTSYDTDSDNLAGNARLTWRKKLTDAGSSIVGYVRANLSDSDLNAYLSSTTGIYGRGDVLTYHELQQNQWQLGREFSHTERLSVTHPLGEGRTLEVFGERSVISEDRDKTFHDIADGHAVFNDRLSSEFEKSFSYLRGGAQLSLNQNSSWLTTGVNVQRSNLQGVVLDAGETITNGFTHVLPWALFRTSLKEGRSLDLRYNARTREPSVTELQPFADNSNPLRVNVGNPALTPEYRHAVRAQFRSYDQFSFVNLFAAFNATYTRNRIVPSRQVDAQLRQVISAVNSDIGWDMGGNVYFGTPLRRLGVRLDLSNNFSASTGSEFVNDAENKSRILRNTSGVRVSNRARDIIDIEAGFRATLNNINYSLNEELNRNYVNSTFDAEASYHPGFAWTIRGALYYRIYDQEVFGPGQNVAILEASISRLVMNERAEVQLSVDDLLNQNQGVNFTNSSTYIQEERIESLGRYVMLKFMYRLSPLGNFGGKGGRGSRGRR